MIGDFGSPSSSLMVDQELRGQSPGRRRNDISKLSSSFSTTPNVVRSPQRNFSSPRNGHKTVTIYDHIVQWFHDEISTRSRRAAGFCAIISVFLFVLTVSLLKLSIWSPFESVKDSLTWFLYPSQWIPICIHGIAMAAVSLFYILSFCKVDQTETIPITDTLAWTAVAAEFAQKLLFLYCTFYLSDSHYAQGFPLFAISIGLLVSSMLFVFKNDFCLTFPAINVNNIRSLIDYIKSLPYHKLAEDCGKDAAIALTASVAVTLFFGPFLSGFQTWWYLISIPFYFNLIVLFLVHQLYSRLFMKAVNEVVMKPISFGFPPSYIVHSPTPEQTRTLINVIEINDPLLKTFALYDLRVIAWNDEVRRKEIFSLSQPGGHARNWKALSSICFLLLDELCSKMTQSSARLVGCSWGDTNDEDEMPRDALMMPRRMREMAYRGQLRNIAPIRSLNSQSSLADRIIKKVGGNHVKAVVSRFESKINSYAAEALYMLIVCSLGEDRFGVVQKDLKENITLLCRLISSIDTYERARASVADKSDVTYLRMVNASLQSSLVRVHKTFGSHLSSLNLPEECIRTIRLVCQIDNI